jgi:hypothetical protein
MMRLASFSKLYNDFYMHFRKNVVRCVAADRNIERVTGLNRH